MVATGSIKNTLAKIEKFFSPFWLKIILVVLLLGLGLVLINYLSLRYKVTLAKDPAKKQATEAKEITRQLRRLVVLPNNQQPKIATIINAEVARKQNRQFYAHANDGDVVVIFGETAYIYRPKLKRIINMGPVYNN